MFYSRFITFNVHENHSPLRKMHHHFLFFFFFYTFLTYLASPLLRLGNQSWYILDGFKAGHVELICIAILNVTHSLPPSFPLYSYHLHPCFIFAMSCPLILYHPCVAFFLVSRGNYFSLVPTHLTILIPRHPVLFDFFVFMLCYSF